MVQDLARYFSGKDAPSWLRALKPEDVGSALFALAHPKSFNPGPVPHTMMKDWKISSAAFVRDRDLAKRIWSDVYKPFSQQHGKSNIDVWVNKYWDWLRRGTPTVTKQASTLKNLTRGNYGTGDLTYVEGVGYVTRDELSTYRPEAAESYQQAKTAAETTEGIDPYYETFTQTVGKPAREVWGKDQGVYSRYKGVKSYEEWLRGKTWTPGQPTPPRGGGGVRVSIKLGSSAGANQAGNYAATAQPGAVSRSPANTYYADPRVRDTIAKRVGRDISQSGVSRIPNMREEYSRRYRQMYRRY